MKLANTLVYGKGNKNKGVIMKCPLPSFYRSYPSGDVAAEPKDCLKEECAWWDTAYQGCSILSVVRELTELVIAMDHLAREINQGVLRK